MKTILLTMMIGVLTVAVSYGQTQVVRPGSAADLQRRMNVQFEQGKEKRRHDKAIEFGRTLFGADKRWTEEMDSEIAGTLAHRRPPDFKIGDWGCTKYFFRVLNKVSNNECLVLPVWRTGGVEVMLIRGLDMSKVTDGVEFILQHPAAIQETYNYQAVSGSQKTVLVLECGDKVNEIVEAAQKAAYDIPYRKWVDSTGKFSVVARLIEFKNGKVVLKRRDDGKQIALPMAHLSREDQKWTRDELKRRAAEKRKATPKKSRR